LVADHDGLPAIGKVSAQQQWREWGGPRDGAFTTGQNLVIDGGSLASLFINPEGGFDQ
jgi:hypothetical protein